LPIIVLQTISVGRSVARFASAIAASTASHRGRRHSVDHVPAVGLEAARGVVDEPRRDLAVDRDAVVVVQHDQLAELPGAGERADLVADAFHQAAVADEDVRVVVDDRVAVAVEFARQQLLGERHADRIGETLAERPGGRLDPRRDTEFRMARRLAVELAEIAQLREREVVAGQVQQRVDQHRRVTVRQHEAVAFGPVRIARVMAEVAAPQRDRHLGHAHRRARMARVRLLHRIHRQTRGSRSPSTWFGPRWMAGAEEAMAAMRVPVRSELAILRAPSGWSPDRIIARCMDCN
jgi:hypothetical protein